MFLYFKFLERDGNRGLGLLPLYSLDWIGLSALCLYSNDLQFFICLVCVATEVVSFQVLLLRH